MSALASSNAASRPRVRGARIGEAKASTAVYGYSLVMRGSDDKIVPLISSTIGVFEGVLSQDTILSTATERKCTIAREGQFLMPITGAAITKIDMPVFCSTDNPADATLTYTEGAKKIGRLVELEYDAAGAITGKGWVEIETGLAANQNVIEHNTASRTLLRGESGKVLTNLGAAGAIVFTLPQDAPIGTTFRFVAMTAQELRVTPGAAGAIYISGAKQTDNKYISFDDEGEQVTLVADGNGDWIAGPTNGTITVES